MAALALDGGRAFAVANALDGSVSFVDVGEGRVETVVLGPRGAGGDDPVARGRRLFSDAGLSHDGWMSCHTCHPDGHGTGQLVDTLGDGSFGTPKRVLSLLGTAETAPYAWTGAQPTLEAQIEKTLRTTMHAEEFTAETVSDLAAYLRSLPAPSMPERDLSPAAARGWTLFETSGCTDCHVPPLFTSEDSYDVGLRDEAGTARFNPPSLRGVGRRPRLFHDGRHGSLEELLERGGHPGTEALDRADIRDLAAYLRTL